MEMTNNAMSTPSAAWCQAGEPDPHAGHYDCERAKLTMGHLTDDELANGAFLNYDQPLNVQGILAGTHASPIAWMTAVKDRIRWLSRALEQAKAERDALAAKLAELEGQEPVFAFRRRGQTDFCTCTEGRYNELAEKPHLFEVRKLYARPVPAEMSPEFTDTARSALLWVLWHHQGGSSPVGQPIRYALGMDAHDWLSDYQVQEAKRWAELTNSETRDFHRRPAEPVNARLLEALKQAQMALIGYLPLHRNEITEAAIECACAAIAAAGATQIKPQAKGD